MTSITSGGKKREDMTFGRQRDHNDNGSQKSAASTRKGAAASKIAPDSRRSNGSRSATGSERSALQNITLLSNNNEEPDCYLIADGTFGEAGITNGGPAQNSAPEDVPFDMVKSRDEDDVFDGGAFDMVPVTPPVEHQAPQDAPLDEVQAAVAPVSPTEPAVVESKLSDEDDVFDGLEDEPRSGASVWYSKTTEEAPVPQEAKIPADVSVVNGALSYLSVIFISIQRAICVPSSLLGQLQTAHEGDAPSLDEAFGSGSAEDQTMQRDGGGSQLSYSDGESIMETTVSFVSEKLKRQNDANSGKSKSPETPQIQEDSLAQAKQGQAVGSESDDSFMDYVDVHISALVKDCDCAAVGTKGLLSYNWDEAQTALLSPFVIDDGDIDGMLDVLKRVCVLEPEIERTSAAIE